MRQPPRDERGDPRRTHGNLRAPLAGDDEKSRDFQKLSFRDACAKTKNNPLASSFPSREWQPNQSPIRLPSSSWQKKAKKFTESSHQRLLIDKTAIDLIAKRGLSVDTVGKNLTAERPEARKPKQEKSALAGRPYDMAVIPKKPELCIGKL